MVKTIIGANKTKNPKIINEMICKPSFDTSLPNFDSSSKINEAITNGIIKQPITQSKIINIAGHISISDLFIYMNVDNF